MKKLNETRSLNLRVVSDDQLEQVVGGWGGHHASHGGGHGSSHLSNNGGQGSTSRHNGGHQGQGRGSVNITINNFFITSDNIGGSGNSNNVTVNSRNF